MHHQASSTTCQKRKGSASPSIKHQASSYQTSNPNAARRQKTKYTSSVRHLPVGICNNRTRVKTIPLLQQIRNVGLSHPLRTLIPVHTKSRHNLARVTVLRSFVDFSVCGIFGYEILRGKVYGFRCAPMRLLTIAHWSHAKSDDRNKESGSQPINFLWSYFKLSRILRVRHYIFLSTNQQKHL